MSEQHPLRRKDRAISQEESQRLLLTGEYCVLATVDKEGTPYATPLSYIFMDDKIFFHSACQGHKIENLKHNPCCTLAVIGATQPVYAKNFTTYYESVIVFGRAAPVTDSAEKTRVLMALARKYLPEHMDKAEKDIAASLARTAVYAISIEKLSGKAKRNVQPVQ